MLDEPSTTVSATPPAPELSPDPSVGRTIARLARQVELGAATAELSLSQYRVIAILDSGQEAASTLAEKLAVSRPSITGIIDGLVARGFVRRDPVDGDRRRIDVHLTPAGAAALLAADTEVARRLAAVAEFMEPADGDPYIGFGPWRAALNAYRRARRERR